MYKRIYDSDEIVVDLDGRKLRVSVFDEDCHWLDEHIVELPEGELEPVVHAHWIEHDDDLGLSVECSACHIETCGKSPRCPNCGAHMDETE